MARTAKRIVEGIGTVLLGRFGLLGHFQLISEEKTNPAELSRAFVELSSAGFVFSSEIS